MKADKIDQVKLLVESKANIFIRKTTNGKTPLHAAARSNKPRSLDIIRYLVSQGGDVNDPDRRGETTIHLAAKHCSFKVFQQLLEMGADINICNSSHDTILHFAAQNKNVKVMKEVLRLTKLKLDVRNRSGCTPLHYAAQNGNIDGCEFLLSEGVDINEMTDNFQTPLHLAILGGKIDMIKFFLRHEAEIHEGLLKAYSDEGYEEINLILLRHVVRKNFDVDVASRKWKYEHEDIVQLEEYAHQCASELESMRNFQVYDNVTMLDITIASSEKLAGYVRNGGKIDMIKFFLRQEAQIHEGLLKAYNDEGYEEINLILLRHVVRKNFGIDAASRKWKYDPDDVEQLEEYSEQCARELESMRNFQIYDNVTMLDITTASSEKLAGYVRNGELVMAFTQRSNASLFPIYSEDTDARIIDEWMRQRILQDASTVLSRIILGSGDSRHLVLEVIMNYLSFNDLIRIAAEINNPEIVDEVSRIVPNTENN